MKEAFQLNLAHRPEEGKWGDCLRACVASLFELEPEEVPHFAENASDVEMTERLRAWLLPRDLSVFFIQIGSEEYEETCSAMVESGMDAYHLLGGVGIGGVRHVVVARFGRCIHDPTPEGIPGRGELLPDPETGYDFVFFVKRFL